MRSNDKYDIIKHTHTQTEEGIVLVTEFTCLTAGLLESSMRLKPHEAQSYRKKALWVSWVSIVVTLILAVAAFSKNLKYSFMGNVWCCTCSVCAVQSGRTDCGCLFLTSPLTQRRFCHLDACSSNGTNNVVT